MNIYWSIVRSFFLVFSLSMAILAVGQGVAMAQDQSIEKSDVPAECQDEFNAFETARDNLNQCIRTNTKSGCPDEIIAVKKSKRRFISRARTSGASRLVKKLESIDDRLEAIEAALAKLLKAQSVKGCASQIVPLREKIAETTDHATITVMIKPLEACLTKSVVNSDAALKGVEELCRDLHLTDGKGDGVSSTISDERCKAMMAAEIEKRRLELKKEEEKTKRWLLEKCLEKPDLPGCPQSSKEAPGKKSEDGGSRGDAFWRFGVGTHLYSVGTEHTGLGFHAGGGLEWLDDSRRFGGGLKIAVGTLKITGGGDDEDDIFVNMPWMATVILRPELVAGTPNLKGFLGVQSIFVASQTAQTLHGHSIIGGVRYTFPEVVTLEIGIDYGRWYASTEILRMDGETDEVNQEFGVPGITLGVAYPF